MRQEKVLELHNRGFNCCQSVLSSFASDLAVDEPFLLRLGSAFGGGIKRGEVCGAVTGALMVLGLAKGFSSMEEPRVKEEAGLWTESFLSQFEATCGALRCKDLLGYDFSISGERDKAKEAGITAKVCPQLMVQAVVLTEKLLESNRRD